MTFIFETTDIDTKMMTMMTMTNVERGAARSSSTLRWTATAFRLALLIASVIVAAFGGGVRGRLIYRGGDHGDDDSGGDSPPPVFEEEAWGYDIDDHDNDNNRIGGNGGITGLLSRSEEETC